MYYPTLKEARALAQSGPYGQVPVTRELLSDFITPIQALRILRSQDNHCFLLESAADSQGWGRYSFLGFEPSLEVTCKDGIVQLKSETRETETRFSAPGPVLRDLLDVYRMLRTTNPSPYLFYFTSDDMELAGASPETLVKLEDGVLHTFPLAGTRPRGKTREEDLALEAELRADEKERAEHNMLVDLGRNDIGKISRFGTVEVEEYMAVQRYSHVMHLGSTVRGELREGLDAVDAIDAILPAGTLSGAPKLRAMEIIDQLENNKRGTYGGVGGAPGPGAHQPGGAPGHGGLWPGQAGRAVPQRPHLRVRV